jgi:prephenate dehydrogenase
MVETIKQVAPFLKKNSMVLDVCSIKKASSRALKKYSPK